MVLRKGSGQGSNCRRVDISPGKLPQSARIGSKKTSFSMHTRSMIVRLGPQARCIARSRETRHTDSKTPALAFLSLARSFSLVLCVPTEARATAQSLGRVTLRARASP